MSASASLSPDLERALQQAVGDANDAAVTVKFKKPKRAREGGGPDVPFGDKPAKKKKRIHSSGVDSAPHEAATDAPEDHLHESGVLEVPVAEEQRKKKKKKDKGKEKEGRMDVSTDLVGEEDPATSSADFLSAVVAAASATAGAHPTPGAPYDPAIPQFVDYPQELPYTFPSPDHPLPFGHPPAGFPLDTHGHPVPDLNFASSEDLLRALQDLDFAKVASVLKSLGDAAVAANVQLDATPPYPHVAMTPPPVKNVPVRSEAILGRPPKPPVPAHIVKNVPGLAQIEVENPDHAHMLSHVWMNANKLADMVENEGLLYKKGKFSAIEEAQLSAAIETFRVSKGLSMEDLVHTIFSKDKGRDAFWTEITSALHLRPIIAVYHHVRRKYHPFKQKGKWTQSEDQMLLDAIQELGQQWEKISLRVGRMSSDCRDRYRNHLENRDLRQSGAWTKAEEEELTRIVTQMTIEQGRDIDNDIFWGVVSQRMGSRRGRQQCRIKWTDSLALQIKNMGEKPRWSQLDAYILVHKVDSMNVRDDSEIDWKQLTDEHWNVWSAHALQRRWMTLKKSIKGYEEMSHAEIMEILKTKKAQSPPPPATARRKKATSAAAVIDGDESDTGEPQAGTSTGPGTASAEVV